mgnify:CR=1 FL=1
MKTILQIIVYLCFTIPALFGLYCCGTESEPVNLLRFNNGELYYTENVEEQEALKLGDFLAKENFYFNGDPKSVQLDKDGKGYILRLVVIEGAHQNPANIGPFTSLGIIVSKEVFDRAPVHINLCDKDFNTLMEIPYKSSAL